MIYWIETILGFVFSFVPFLNFISSDVNLGHKEKQP